MDLPGNLGFPLLGDSSIDFVRDPNKYVQKRRERHGDIFRVRIINKPMAFATSSRAACEMLREKASCFEMGYKEFLFELFDQNLIFQEGQEWKEARTALERVFAAEKIPEYLMPVKQIINDFFASQNFPVGQPIVIYKAMKKLSTQLSMALFLGIQPSQPEADKVSELMTTHWRGIISVPISMSLPGAWWRSGYSKALSAKEQLLKIIEAQLKSNPSMITAEVMRECPVEHDAIRNILVFVSAVIPKALASILTSFVIELAKPCNSEWLNAHESKAKMDDVMLEIERLWPPLFGGRRMCTQDCEIGGFKVPRGYGAAYVASCANQDPTCFANPNKFQPDRWQASNAGDRDKVLTYGSGPRQCVGKLLAQKLLRECGHHLLAGYSWELVEPDMKLDYKTLPVLRPVKDVQALFRKKINNNSCRS